MKIYLANPRGFCAGVDRAIDIVELSLKAYGAHDETLHGFGRNCLIARRLLERDVRFVPATSLTSTEWVQFDGFLSSNGNG